MTALTFKRLAIPAALVVGGVTIGSFLSPIDLASAAETDSDDTDTGAGSGTETDADAETDADGDHDHRGGRFGHRGVKAEVLEDLFGLSTEEIRDALSEGGSLADLAEAQGVPVEDLTAALVQAASDRLDEAVAEGHIDAETAEERKAGLDERMADLVDRVPSEEMGRRGHRGGARGLLGVGSDVVQETLGLTAEEIRDGMAEGKTLSDLAADQGVSTDDLADAMVAAATERLDEAVADGKIDEERAATAKEALEERIDDIIEAEPFALGRGVGRAESRGLRFHHRNHHHGDDGSTADSDGETVESSLSDA